MLRGSPGSLFKLKLPCGCQSKQAKLAGGCFQLRICSMSGAGVRQSIAGLAPWRSYLVYFALFV